MYIPILLHPPPHKSRHKQATTTSKQATSTSQMRFVNYCVMTGACAQSRVGVPNSPVAAFVQVPIEEVPSQIWAALGRKEPF